MTIQVHPNPDGTAIVSWNGQAVALMRSVTFPPPPPPEYDDTMPGYSPDGLVHGWEMITHGGLFLSSLQADTLLASLEDRIKARTGSPSAGLG